MKLPFQIDNSRSTLKRCSPAVASAPKSRITDHGSRITRPASRSARRALSGMALIITLILLSVTLVMAIAFLALSNREQNAVKTTTDTAIARYASETALAEAQARIVASIIQSPAAAYNFGLLVSTNYLSTNPFVANLSNPTNVNYLDAAGALLGGANLEQCIANLQLLPRAPVFVITNRQTGIREFRFWLDLNQNGRYDTNGWVTNVDNSLRGLGSRSYLTGDPEWIGVLERPDVQHGPNNKFISRYAYFAVPSGNTLDLNAIHNEAVTRTVNAPNGPTGQDGYFRNQGVGSWELNLAAFLADLNTNQWAARPLPDDIYYNYLQPQANNNNRGVSFDDARALLSYRYGFAYANLFTASAIFRTLGVPNVVDIFPRDNIDAFSDGPLQIATTNIIELLSAATDGDRMDLHPQYVWLGSDNPNHYFSVNDILDRSKTQKAITYGFTDRLKQAGANNSTYDRYTFYRMLAQLGTDSTADGGKLNLNYSNAVVQYTLEGIATNISIVPGAETNLVPWDSLNFFTAAADKMLRLYTTNWFQHSPSNYLYTYYRVNPRGYIEASGLGVTNIQYYRQTNEIPAFGVTNIPVYVNDRFVYSPAVNRVLQQAANILDARTTNFFPSVFRPIFSRTVELGSDNFFHTNIYVCGYVDISAYSRTNALQPGTALTPAKPPLDLPVDVTSPLLMTNAFDLNQQQYYANAYGVPWIIGAKKGLPSFNQFSMVNAAEITRKLQIKRDSLDSTVAKYTTNQMYSLSISNRVGLSYWNSYFADYPRQLNIYAHDTLYMALSNSTANVGAAYFNINGAQVNSWPGSQWDAQPPDGTPQDASFIRANWTTNYLDDSICYFTENGGYLSFPTVTWTAPGLFQFPLVHLLVTNYLQTYILDGNHVIDYVHLRDPITAVNLSAVLADPDYRDPFNPTIYYQWSTNTDSAGSDVPNSGVINQTIVSKHPEDAPTAGGKWIKPPTMPAALGSTPEAEAAFFRGFFDPSFKIPGDPATYVNAEYVVQAPYTPTRTVFSAYLMQANDPLVHYLASDLNAQVGATAVWDNKTLKNGIWNKVGDTAVQHLPTPPTTPTAGGRYEPWGRKGQLVSAGGSIDTNTYNLQYKDPLIWGADDWDFPTNQYPSVGWLGRVHRGTPWQTVYLKAHNVLKNSAKDITTGTNTWVAWTGDLEQINGQYFDAVNMAPLQDRLLFDVFTARLDDNAAHGTLSVNQHNLAAWSAVFGGLVALSNNLAKPSAGDPVSTANLTINPAGLDIPNSAMGRIFAGITSAQANFTNANGVVGVFSHVGDILSAPVFTENSPFLNTNVADKLTSPLKYGISDEVYEWLPQQTLGLLRCPVEPRYTIYCFGQTLRPAQGGLVQSGPFFGMVTNYQVVAESASRAVIQVHAQPVFRSDGRAMTNYSTSVESFNALAPE